MCSTTCGPGQKQRSRKCIGGPPGTGACTNSAEFGEVNGKMQQLTLSSNGAVNTHSCGDDENGNCCEFEWSGWSNCCLEGTARKTVRWKGHQCDGKWENQELPCGEVIESNVNTMKQCLEIYNIQQNYFTGQKNAIEITEVQTVGGRTTYTGQNIYYGRRLDDGMYTVGGKTYVLKNSGENQVWFISNGSSQTKVEVETFESKTTHTGSTWYYKFEKNWYKYRMVFLKCHILG